MSVSVNYKYSYADVDYIFISNLRRFRELPKDCNEICIVTSNISSNQIYLQTDYRSLLSPIEAVEDNAGMMAIRFFINQGADKILLAGFDGYSYDSKENYASAKLEIISKNAVLDAMNRGMEEMIDRFRKEISIEFLTERKFLNCK